MSRVVVREVQPGKLHGFRPGELRLDALEPGLNVFYAPNASGKSTLARAIGLLLNPTACDPDATVLGRIEGPSGMVDRAVRRGDAALDGFPGRPESYLLDLVRLLEGFRERDEQAVLQRLVADNVRLSPGAPSFRKPVPVGHATAALDALRAVRRETGGVAEVEDRLDALRAEAARAGEASGIVRALDRAAERRRLERARAEAIERIDALEAAHPGLDRQSEGAEATAAALRRSHATASRALANARAEVALVCEATPSRSLRPDERESLRTGLAGIGAAEAAWRSAAVARDAWAARLAGHAETLLLLLPGEEPTALPHPTARDMDALRSAAIEADRLRAETLRDEAYEAAHRLWRERHPDDDSDLGTSIEACHAWLTDEASVPLDRRPVALVVVMAATAVVVAYLGDAAVRWAIAVVGLVAALGVMVGLRPKPSASRRSEIEARFPDLFRDAKDTAAVADRLRELLLRAARREVRADLASRAQATASPSVWPEVAARLRLRASDPCLLSPIASAVSAHAEARTGLREAEAALSRTEREKSEARAGLATILLAHGFPFDAARPEGAAGEFVRWFDLAAAFDAREGEEAEAGRALDDHLDLNGVPPGPLERRSSELVERGPLAAGRRRWTVTLAEAERSLAALEPTDGALDDLTDEEARMLRDEKQALLDRVDALNVEIGRAEAQIADAEATKRLPAAEDAYARAYAMVETKWDEMVRGAVRARLHTALAERLRREEVPPIVRAANAHLHRFSRGRYRLELAAATSEGLGTLVVRDGERGREQRFAELSTGTKVHAIVALRLGLIEEHERQANGGTLRFPLVADEAMAVSDPEASAAIAQALVDVAETRQVILFTNQPDDLAILGRIVEGFAPRSLGSAIPPAVAGPTPSYRPPQGPRAFDPTLPVRAHAVGAVLPFGGEDVRVGEWLHAEGEAWVVYVEGLERMRSELLAEHPRLEWSAISDAAWTKNAFREAAQRLAEGCGGSAREFLRGFGNLPRNQRRTVEQAEAWLEERHYLAEPPGETEIQALAFRVFGKDADPFQVEHALRLFRAGFD